MSAVSIVALVVRYGMVMLFLPFSALDKVLNFEGAVSQAQEVFKPRALATVVLMCGFCIEVFASLGVVTGIADRLCALLIAGYCAVTAVLYKRFWAPGDFWHSGDSKARNLFWDFLKNLSLGAGLLLIVIGTNGSGLKPFLSNPLGSSDPYASPEHHR
jgi:putative oxidoreductase